jgi:hypothetical protein
MSPVFNHDFSAILHSTGFKISQGFLIKIPASIACLYVGTNFNSKFVSILSFIQIGFNQIKNNTKNIKNAKTKFIKTQASIMIACCQAGFLDKL